MSKEFDEIILTPEELDAVSGGVEIGRDNGASDQGGTYIVQEGDSLHSIAQKYGMSTKVLFINNIAVIVKAANEHGYTFINPVDYANMLFPGTVLKVPYQVDSSSNSLLC